MNLDIDQLSGTGPNGRITRADVEGARSTCKPSATAPAKSKSSNQSFEEIPNTPLRKAIASRLTQSKQEIPHFYLKATANAEKIISLRADLNATGRVKVSLNDLIIKLAARTLEKVPDVNVNWTADAIRKFNQIDISIAVAGPRGLVTPVLRDLASKSVFEIATEVGEFREKINTNTLKQNEIEGGSISISNLGMYGTEEFSAIINPHQAAILAVGAARKEAVVIEDGVEVVNVIHFVLSVDHRSVDGALAAQWMQEFIKSVEAPIEILL
jgi:pyruvate dehydrogenase E2 component (dihydrolipoamide acetyltransferase)